MNKKIACFLLRRGEFYASSEEKPHLRNKISTKVQKGQKRVAGGVERRTAQSVHFTPSSVRKKVSQKRDAQCIESGLSQTAEAV